MATLRTGAAHDPAPTLRVVLLVSFVLPLTAAACTWAHGEEPDRDSPVLPKSDVTRLPTTTPQPLASALAADKKADTPAPATEPEPEPKSEPEQPQQTWYELTVPMRPIYAEPRRLEAHSGTLREGHPFLVHERAEGKGCKGPWGRVGDRGWVCTDIITETDKRPTENDDPLPFEYATVFEDTEIFSAPSKRAKTGRTRKRRSILSILERQDKWVRAYPNEWIPARILVDRPDRSSSLAGVPLGDDTNFPFAFVRHNHVKAYPVPGLRKKSQRRKHKDQAVELKRFSRHDILETWPEGRPVGRADFLRIEEGWVLAWQLSIVDKEERHRYVDEGERWIRVDLSEQNVVAYEGDRPVWTTMVSTGENNDDKKTPKGAWRLTNKLRSARMSGGSGASYHYVSDVPWVQYFNRGIALHGVYWHNAFGWPTSNGCINLTPHDAKWLFEFTSPTLETGWYSEMVQRGEGTWVVVGK